MPRRMIDSAMSTDEKLARLSFKAQFLWPWLIPHCSDQGRMLADPLKIKLTVVPGVNDITWQDVEAILQEYAGAGMAILYTANKVAIIQIANWWKHQHMQWAYPDPLPAPEGWRDHLRYRKDGKVITENWLEGNSQPMGDPEPTPAEPLPIPLPKAIPNGEPSLKESHRSRSSSSSKSSIKNRAREVEREGAKQEEPPALSPKPSPAMTSAKQRLEDMNASAQPYIDAYLRGRDAPDISKGSLTKLRAVVLANMADGHLPPASDLEACIRAKTTSATWNPYTPASGFEQAIDDFPQWVKLGRPEAFAKGSPGNGQARASPPKTNAENTIDIAKRMIAEEEERERANGNAENPSNTGGGLPVREDRAANARSLCTGPF